MRPRELFSALTGLLLAACASPPLRARAAGPSEHAISVATYNVNFGIPGDGSTVDAIRHTNADIVCLEETTPAWERSLRAELASAYPHMAFVHSRGAGGLAVLARVPFDDLGVTESPVGWFPSWRVRVRSSIGGLQLVLVHLHPQVSESGSYVSGYVGTGSARRAEMERFTDRWDTAIPTLVVGDFNEASGGATHRLERLGLRDVVRDFGLGSTWRWPTSFGEIHMTFDHVFYSSQLRPLGAWVAHEGRSDHLPVLATFVRADAT